MVVWGPAELMKTVLAMETNMLQSACRGERGVCVCVCVWWWALTLTQTARVRNACYHRGLRHHTQVVHMHTHTHTHTHTQTGVLTHTNTHTHQ